MVQWEYLTMTELAGRRQDNQDADEDEHDGGFSWGKRAGGLGHGFRGEHG